MSKLSSTNEMLSCRQRAASARGEATAPSPDVLVGIHNNTTVILAQKKSTVPRLPKITHAEYQATRPGFGMTHQRERLLTPGAASHRRLPGKR